MPPDPEKIKCPRTVEKSRSISVTEIMVMDCGSRSGVDSIVSYSGCASLDGIVYMSPYHSNHVLTIDTTSDDTMDGIGIDFLGVSGGDTIPKFSGLLPHGGKLYAAPAFARKVLGTPTQFHTLENH